MSMNMFVGRIHCLHPSRNPKPLAAAASSNTPSQFAVEYLVRSCGLSSQEALRASKAIQHVKSPDKPDAVLRFLREVGVSEPHIRTAASRCPRFLCSSVDKNVRPNIQKLLQVGLSIQQISDIIASNPRMLTYNLVPKVDFWLRVLASIDHLPLVFKVQNGVLVCSNLDNVLIPNLSFLTDQCCFSTRQIIRLIKSNPRLISLPPQTLTKLADRAAQLGFDPKSGTFLHVLIIVGYLSQHIIDARIHNLTRFGFSQDQVKEMISKFPFLLNISEEVLNRKIEFLMREMGCDKSYFLRYPNLLAYSLENRLIPRSVVLKLLMSKKIPAANVKLNTVMMPSEEEFMRKYVWPYKYDIPSLFQAYLDAKKN